MQPAPELAREKIAFPSDQVTLGTLRRLYPSDYEAGEFFTSGKAGSLSTDLANMLFVERVIAEMAFDKIVGKQWDAFESETYRNDVLAEIAELYIRYGIASGPHHANQLFRDIESQADAQARQHSGRRP